MLLDRNALKMLQRMGVKTTEIKAQRVVIETEDGALVFENPSVVVTEFSGQKVYQIAGEPKKEESIREEDVELVMEKTGKSREEVVQALKETNGDIAEAIMRLM